MLKNAFGCRASPQPGGGPGRERGGGRKERREVKKRRGVQGELPPLTGG